jgi:two-component system, OmpR family, response regulator RegX3
MTRVLIVEDEPSIRESLAFMLSREGYDVIQASEGCEAVEQFSSTGADIVLLDLMLPGMNGREVFRALRQRSAVPIIMVTASDSEVDKVLGLEMGADDYVTKPFSTRELTARIRTILRRGSGEIPAIETSVLKVGQIRMDVDRHAVTVKGLPVHLSHKEFVLLELLMRSAGRVVSRGQLIDRVFGPEYDGDGKALDVHVRRIRAKVEEDPSRPRHVVTVHGLGYKCTD